jgi:hypothetical protein
MEEATTSLYGAIFVAVMAFVSGWLFGQIIPWRRLRHPLGRISGDGGIEYVLHDLEYNIKRDGSNRTTVELRGSLFDPGVLEEAVRVSITTRTPSPVADELHRIHTAGAMVCVLRSAEKGSKTGKVPGQPRDPVRMVSKGAEEVRCTPQSG